MLQKTFRKLAALNTIVFLLILLAFGGVIYSYVAHRLFDEVDQSLRLRTESFRVVNGRVSFVRTDPALFDPRIFLLLRDQQGNMLNLYPAQLDETGAITELAYNAVSGKPQIRIMQGHMYRVLVLPYAQVDNKLIRAAGTFIVHEVIAISIVDSEAALLRSLLVVMATASAAGLLSVILAGFYLARRAMSPIRAAWDKQQQFVADASHELRTPLTIIRSNAELVLRHPLHTVQEESIRITNIVRESIRMNRLVSTLLTLARADANEGKLQLAPVRVDQVAEAVAEEFGPIAEMKGLELRSQVEGPITVKADKDRLHQLLVILLDNALKYTTYGQVILQCRQTGSNASIEVRDTGHGILPEHLPYIFDRFFRVDKARSREEGGIGLGLSIAKWIVEQHDGKIKAESETGKGTIFTVTLPLHH